jgi:YesN/AraC family two-component response regulator
MSLNIRNGYFIHDDGKDKLLISFSSSDYNGWRYIAVKPLSKIPSGLQFFSRILLSVALATLLIGLILSFLSAKKFYSPLKKLVDICKNSSIYENTSNESTGNEYEIINCTMNSLVYKLKDQNKKLEDNFPIIKHHFIIDLINSHFTNEDDILCKMNLLNIDLKFPYFMAIIIKPENMNTLLDHRAYEYSKINLMEAVESLLLEKGINCICTEYNKNIICILNLEHSDIDIINRLEEIYIELVELSQLRIQIGMGSICGDILQVAGTYSTACNCIKYAYIYPEHAIFTPEEISQWEDNTNTSAARRILQQLASDLHEQDKNKIRLRAHELVNLIREEHYSYSCAIKLLAGILDIIENYLNELKINSSGFEQEDIASVLIKAGNILQYQTQLDSLIKDINLLVSEKHDERNKQLVKKVKKYISENISSGNISLENVASAMYISPSYLSRIFRNEAGINFIDYVMDMKLDWSKELLLTGSKKIEDISLIIGYSNPQYFIKKFKLKYGITPKNYLRSQ